jgi:hypothetical protein
MFDVTTSAERPVEGNVWSFRLPAGEMQLTLRAADMAPEALFGMAQRENPKRAFLFVSRLLGRHIPVAPAAHRDALRRLAAKAMLAIREETSSGGVLVTGFAETAVGLGAGIHDELRRMGVEGPLAYLPSTRHPEAGSVWFSFSEDHSHAAAHQVLHPVTPEARRAALEARTLVMVDDETTTGRTFANKVRGFREEGGRRFDRIVLVTLTDWSEGRAQALVAEAAGLSPDDVAIVSLASGSWTWIQDPDVTLSPVPMDEPALAVDGLPAGIGAWRAGICEESAIDMARVLDQVPVARPEAAETLLIGTGENVWFPFRFAEAMADLGEPCRFLATTRSPVSLGDTIRKKIVFSDHYGIGLPMYLHNVDPAEWRRILLFIEREDAGGICHRLSAALGAFTAVTPSGACLSFSNGVLQP